MTTTTLKLALWQVTATMHPDADAAAWVSQFPGLHRKFGFEAASREVASDHRIDLLAPADYANMLQRLREVTENPDLHAPAGAFAVQMTIPGFDEDEAKESVRPYMETLASQSLSTIVALDAHPSSSLGKSTSALVKDLAAARAERGGEKVVSSESGPSDDPDISAVLSTEQNRVADFAREIGALSQLEEKNP